MEAQKVVDKESVKGSGIFQVENVKNSMKPTFNNVAS